MYILCKSSSHTCVFPLFCIFCVAKTQSCLFLRYHSFTWLQMFKWYRSTSLHTTTQLPLRYHIPTPVYPLMIFLSLSPQVTHSSVTWLHDFVFIWFQIGFLDHLAKNRDNTEDKMFALHLNSPCLNTVRHKWSPEQSPKMVHPLAKSQE